MRASTPGAARNLTDRQCEDLIFEAIVPPTTALTRTVLAATFSSAGLGDHGRFAHLAGFPATCEGT